MRLIRPSSVPVMIMRSDGEDFDDDDALMIFVKDNEPKFRGKDARFMY